MRKISLVVSLILFSLVTFISCQSTEPVESQSPAEPEVPANPKTIQDLILARRYD